MNREPAGILERLVESNEQLVRELTALRDRTRRLEDQQLLEKMWYTATDCARLKGVSVSALSEKWRQPLGGHGKRQIAGLWRWHRDVVVEWLLLDDQELHALYAGDPRVSGVA